MGNAYTKDFASVFDHGVQVQDWQKEMPGRLPPTFSHAFLSSLLDTYFRVSTGLPEGAEGSERSDESCCTNYIATAQDHPSSARVLHSLVKVRRNGSARPLSAVNH